jgi:uncharacterized phage-associated protein
MGPVPDRFNSIYEYLSTTGNIAVNYIPYSTDITGEQFIPAAQNTFEASLFSEPELQILEQVAERFKDSSNNEIIKISHQERAWIENKDNRDLISYFYAFDLK